MKRCVTPDRSSLLCLPSPSPLTVPSEFSVDVSPTWTAEVIGKGSPEADVNSLATHASQPLVGDLERKVSAILSRSDPSKACVEEEALTIDKQEVFIRLPGESRAELLRDTSDRADFRQNQSA